MTSCSPMYSKSGADRRVQRLRVVHADERPGRRHPSPQAASLMYAALWRVLPGPVWVRIVILIVLVAVILYGLIWWVFPWVSQIVDPEEVTVQ